MQRPTDIYLGLGSNQGNREQLIREAIVLLSVNDTRTFCYPRIETDKQGQFPFDKPYYLVIDQQLGGDWVGDVAMEDLPMQMEIDWVRFYQKE